MDLPKTLALPLIVMPLLMGCATKRSLEAGRRYETLSTLHVAYKVENSVYLQYRADIRDSSGKDKGTKYRWAEINVSPDQIPSREQQPRTVSFTPRFGKLPEEVADQGDLLHMARGFDHISEFPDRTTNDALALYEIGRHTPGLVLQQYADGPPRYHVQQFTGRHHGAEPWGPVVTMVSLPVALAVDIVCILPFAIISWFD